MTSTPDAAELLKDVGKPQLFDENDADASFFTVSEDDSILLRHMNDVVDTSPDKCHRHRAIGEMANPRNQHIGIPQIQYTDKVADESVAVQLQISPRTTATKAPEHQQDDRSGGDADKDVQGEAITKIQLVRREERMHLELDGLDNVTEDAFKAESGKTKMSLTIAAVAGKQRIFTLSDLAREITGVKVAQKKGKQTVSLKLTKKEKKTWHKLLGEASTKKETVADDTANSNTSITCTLSDFCKNLEEPSPTEEEEANGSMTKNGVVRGKSWTRQTLSDAWESTNLEGLVWHSVANGGSRIEIDEESPS